MTNRTIRHTPAPIAMTTARCTSTPAACSSDGPCGSSDISFSLQGLVQRIDLDHIVGLDALHGARHGTGSGGRGVVADVIDQPAARPGAADRLEPARPFHGELY